MVTTFVRVTVIAEDVQLDISLPGHPPIIDYLPDILELLDIETGDDPSGWSLSTPGHGPLDPLDTLADRHLLDGATVHLTRAEHAAAPPFVDDVLAEMTRTVDADFTRWTGPGRVRWTAALLSGLLVLTAIALTLLRAPVLSGSSLAGIVVVALLLAATTPRALGRWMPTPAGIAGALAAWRFADGLEIDARVSFALAAAALAVAAAGAVARRLLPVAPVGAIVGAVLGLCGLAFTLGLSSVATAAWGAVVFLVALILAPRLALVSSGLLAQLRRSEQLELTARADIDASLARGRHVVDALVWSTSVLAVAAGAAITFLGVWQQGLITLVLGLLLLLRSRAFAHARHVGPLVAAGASILMLSCYRLPDWLGLPEAGAVAVWATGAALLLAMLLLAGLVTLNEVTRAEMRGWLDTADMLLMLSFIPVGVFAQGIYPYFWP